MIVHIEIDNFINILVNIKDINLLKLLTLINLFIPSNKTLKHYLNNNNNISNKYKHLY